MHVSGEPRGQEARQTHRRESDKLISQLAHRAAKLGFEVVDFAGFIEDLDARSASQIGVLGRVRGSADDVVEANSAITGMAEEVREAAASAAQMVGASAERVHQAGRQSSEVVRHIGDIADRMGEALGALGQVQESNASIGEIAVTVKMLAINARIEATRAGEAGAGFSTIAQAINDLAVLTSDTAKTVQDGVVELAETLRRLSEELASVRAKTDGVIAENADTDQALARIGAAMARLQAHAAGMTEECDKSHAATAALAPAIGEIETSIGDTASRISDVRDRAHALVDYTEAIVQDSVSIGGATQDQPFIDRVMADAQRLSAALERAVEHGQITQEALFSRSYEPIPGTEPAQVMAPFTTLTDEIFPPVQEAALELAEEVVFCAAVNLDGYLPTHNRKFSKPQGPDAEWNAGNSRNRRIFDDRVGLKAGRNTSPFLLQVYRRDMGGGIFKVMKDVSAPIHVHGQHWGGLRLAYLA